MPRHHRRLLPTLALLILAAAAAVSPANGHKGGARPRPQPRPQPHYNHDGPNYSRTPGGQDYGGYRPDAEYRPHAEYRPRTIRPAGHGALAGFEPAYKSARQFVGPETTDPSESNVYVTAEGDYLYVETNYRGDRSESAARIASMDGGEIQEFIGGIEAARQASESGGSDGATYYVDQKVFSSKRHQHLGLDGSRKVKVIGDDGVPRPARRITLADNSAQWLVQFRPSVYARAEVGGISGLSGRIESQSFSKDDIRLLPLVDDRATSDKIAELVPARYQVPFDLSSPEALARSLSAHRGRTVFPFGSIEGGSFVVRDARDEVRFTIPVQRLQQLGRENGVTILPLGCKSATVSGSGVAQEFRSVEFIERFGRGMDASNYGEFLDSLSGPDLMIVVDDAVLAGSQHRVSMSVYLDPAKARGAAGAAGGAAAAAAVGSLVIALDREDWTAWLVLLTGGGMLGAGGLGVVVYRLRG